MYDIIVIGAGTAGLSSSIYGVRAGKSVLILEATTYGGQIINTPDIENYPGIKHVSGYEFATDLYEQAINLGAQLKYERVISIEDNNTEKVVKTVENEYCSKAVILATGAKNRLLGLEHEAEWVGAGISYCATCDGAFYRGKDVAVAGGGNTALEDAMFLSNNCNKVYIIHRRDQFRGEKKLLDKLKQNPNVVFILNANITRLIGEDGLDAVEVKDTISGEIKEIKVSGLFIAVGQIPENTAFSNLVQLDQSGYIIAKEDCYTNVEGIFTAGDCRTKRVRQLTTAAADGAVAALAACEFIG